MSEKKELCNEYLKHVFSVDEKKELATILAEKVLELQGCEDEKKAIMSQFKSKIDQTQAEINSAASKLRSGYEMRVTECEIIPDYENKVFCYYRTDNSELVRKKAMTQDDLQKKI